MQGDLARAKKQLQSNLMMNLEARLVQFENVARWMDTHTHTRTHTRHAYIHSLALDLMTSQRVSCLLPVL